MTANFSLNRCAREMLRFVPAYPGKPWFEILEDGPRQGNGHLIPKRYGIDPLVRAGLVAITPGYRLPSGRKTWDRYYRVAP